MRKWIQESSIGRKGREIETGGGTGREIERERGWDRTKGYAVIAEVETSERIGEVLEISQTNHR